MNDLLKKIYEQVLCQEEEIVKKGKYLDEWVNQLTKPYQSQLSSEKMEKLKDLMYSAAATAEREGFQLGVKFTIKIIAELYTDL